MHNTLRVAWQVTPLQCPLVWRRCSRCNSATPFACSMKFRTNAQKKRIDVWLIYRCRPCGETWNMPVLERAAVGDIAPDEFQAIARNDPALAMRYGHGLARLRRYSDRIEDSFEVAIRKHCPTGNDADAEAIEISIALTAPCCLRLDQLLSRELGMARSRLRALLDRGALRVSPTPRKGLRAPAANGQSISIELAGNAIDPELAALIRRRALA